MNSRILKPQLVILFALTVVNIIFHYFGKTFPDNALSISSHTEEVNFFSYYFSSIISVISYYTGIWIALPFLAFSFIYTFISSKRTNNWDVLVPTILVLMFYLGTFALLPKLLGNGLLYLTEETLDIYVAVITSLVFCISLFYICLKGSFLHTLQLFTDWLTYKSLSFYKKVYGSFKKTKVQAQRAIGHVSKVSISEKATKILKSVPKKQIEEQPEVITPRLAPEVEAVEPVVQTTEEIATPESVEVTPKETKKPVEQKLRSTTVKDNFFKSSDLIDCISNADITGKVSNPDQEYFDYIKDAIEDKLGEFKVDAKIINVLKGPVVDTFELELGSGIKVSKVMGLSDDIGLALNGAPIRIVYPMKGRSTIGIEVPRNPRDIILLDEVLRSDHFNSSRHRLPVAMGRNAFGEVSVVDLAAMPHMLVAGATGAGKSVFINTLLVSLIIKMSPRQMKLILIDPKQLELALYQELPHLMLPVITEAKSASIALLWAVQEMERRYSILKEMGVKNIEGFNKKVKNCPKEALLRLNQYYEDQEDDGYELPYLVIIIDEFADLILTKSGKEIEDNVNRLAAKARAAGIHIVLATQRPSTDVVTGVIKANFPTRVAFRVTTATDSRVILDQLGAEKLLGKGDMLYKHGVDVMRVHSSFVEEEEIEQLVDKLSTFGTNFNSAAVDFLESGGEDENGEVSVSFGGAAKPTGDDLYDNAVQVVMEQGSASASMLQRRLRVGYNRAANLIEEMERNGIVGPQQGSKPREILVGRPE
jgi:S-DNA-T family DNA segregation ATPase FtsK/SpoIIIE